ncbi:MAG TPA: hypothetical protein VK465_19240 [Fibrobacteria bacterium]|nr:hypothetical protein [Fibrobacteria bacterium]
MVISRKKKLFPISEPLRDYLNRYTRSRDLPVTYADLLRYQAATPLVDKYDKDTLWATCMYNHSDESDIHKGLIQIYSQLKAAGDVAITDHLYVERVDFCTFGNSNPFRVRIVNQYNDNYDHFYVKKADASRIYGLELEDILSPNRINYLVCGTTLIEEHIAGIPGDLFLGEILDRPSTNKVRIAKEFVKFNERCFARLLGDMRAYNYVVDITPDFEDEQYRVRAIDFDQQSYEGKIQAYLPHFFPDNKKVVALCKQVLNLQTMRQYQLEERTLIARRLNFSREQVVLLTKAMRFGDLSLPEKTQELKLGLQKFHKNDRFLLCENIGDLVVLNLETTLACKLGA